MGQWLLCAFNTVASSDLRYSFSFVGLWVVLIVNEAPIVPYHRLSIIFELFTDPIGPLNGSWWVTECSYCTWSLYGRVCRISWSNRCVAKCSAWRVERKTVHGKAYSLHTSTGLELTSYCPVYHQLSGAKVLQINGQDPFVAVNANALITGSFQALGTRQNSYVISNFAMQWKQEETYFINEC